MSRFVIGFAMAMLVLPWPAAGGGDRQVHDVLWYPPATEFSPAGATCDFNYEWVSSDLVKRNRFFDATGFRYRALWVTDEVNIHRNLDTGMELEEDIQYIVDRDFVNNTWTWAGHTWALRFDGKMVYSFAERFVLDLETGEVIEHSQPYKVRPSFAERICPLLGGHAVPQ